MLGIFVIAGCVLMACAGPPISGYSLGTLSGGRGQEYSGGYRTGGFVGIKDSQGDFGDHRHSIVTGGSSHSTPGIGYTSDSAYADSSIAAGQTSAFGGHTGVGDADSSSSGLAGSSYSTELVGQGGSSELVGASYSTSGSSGSPAGYSTSGSVLTHLGYSEGSGGVAGRPSLGSSLSVGERGEYSSSHPSTSYVSYAGGGPKSSAYTASSSHGSHGHPMSSSYSSSPSFVSGNHGVSSSSSYPSETSHPVITSGPSYSSGPSFSNFLTSMHGNGPSNYIPHGSHRGHHIYASASNPSPGYSSRGPPGSGYFSSNSPYPRGGGGGGGKIIYVKESNAGHPSHGPYPSGEHHSYSGGMFAGANGGSPYKIRSVGSGTGYGPPSFASGYSSSGAGYNGGSPHSSNNHGVSFFGFL